MRQVSDSHLGVSRGGRHLKKRGRRSSRRAWLGLAADAISFFQKAEAEKEGDGWRRRYLEEAILAAMSKLF